MGGSGDGGARCNPMAGGMATPAATDDCHGSPKPFTSVNRCRIGCSGRWAAVVGPLQRVCSCLDRRCIYLHGVGQNPMGDGVLGVSWGGIGGDDGTFVGLGAPNSAWGAIAQNPHRCRLGSYHSGWLSDVCRRGIFQLLPVITRSLGSAMGDRHCVDECAVRLRGLAVVSTTQPALAGVSGIRIGCFIGLWPVIGTAVFSLPATLYRPMAIPCTG